jgi:hypothetical protein
MVSQSSYGIDQHKPIVAQSDHATWSLCFGLSQYLVPLEEPERPRSGPSDGSAVTGRGLRHAPWARCLRVQIRLSLRATKASA